MSFTHDVLLIGHGLAGAAWVEECWRRGLRVAVFAAPRNGEASRVAAGVVNPVVLRRMVPSWRAAELLALARPFYHGIEEREGVQFWHPTPLVEVFANEQRVQQWKEKCGAIDLRSWMSPEVLPGPPNSNLIAPHGHGLIRGCAWLDVKAYLDAQALRLRDRHDLIEASITDAEVSDTDQGVRIGDRHAPLLVRCEGPFADVAGIVAVKGESLVLHIPGLGLDRMVHRGVFVLPLGQDHYRVGATFKWENVWEGPTVQARQWLLQRLSQALSPELMERIEIMDHLAGVRPAAKDRRPILGRISKRQAVFNGLGSRGVLLAPWCARHLATHLFDGAALDAEVDVERFT